MQFYFSCSDKKMKKSSELPFPLQTQSHELHLMADEYKAQQNRSLLTRSLREPGGPCTKSMEVSESRMKRVNI